MDIAPTFQSPNTDLMEFWMVTAPFVCLGIAGLFSCCGVVSDLFKLRRLKKYTDKKGGSQDEQDGETRFEAETPMSRVSSLCATLLIVATLHLHAMIAKTESVSHQEMDTAD